MLCPACHKKVESDAWLCPFCEHIIDPSVINPVDDEDEDVASNEVTKMVPMPPPPASTEEDPLPDAMILGDVGVAEDEFSLVEGAGVQSNGKTSTFLYYATGASTRVVHPDAIPRLTDAADGQPRTPYEDFILSCIDGLCSVRQIQRSCGLQPQEVVVTLLTLMDKGAVHIRTLDGGPGASLPDGRLTPDPEAATPSEPDLEATEEPAREPKKIIARSRRRSRRARTPAPPPAAPASAERVETAPTVEPQALEAEDRTDTMAAVIPTAAKIAEAAAYPVPDGFDEDLPSVSDFHEISEDATADVDHIEDLEATEQGERVVTPPPRPRLEEPDLPPSPRSGLAIPDESTQLADPPPPKVDAPRADSSFSDVWAENPSGALDAEAFIEDERSEVLDEAPQDDDWGPLTGPIGDEDMLEEADPSMSLGPVIPSELEPPPGETPGPLAAAPPPLSAHLPRDPIEESMGPPPSADPPFADPALLDPVVPSELDGPDDEPDVTKEVFIPAKLRPPRASPPPPVRGRSAVVASVQGAPAAPVLDPDLLRPADPSIVAPAPVARARSLAEVVKRAPVEERDRRRPLAKSPKQPVEAATPPPPEPDPVEDVEPGVDPDAPQVDSLHMSKGRKLYEEALKDQEEGNLLSARMNMKLAITFDPSNKTFKAALEALEAAPEAKSAGPAPAGRSKAREYYDAATEAENHGDVDQAIDLLEKAIAESRQAAFLNRLGVVLAMKKQEFSRAQSLIEEAIELSPGNTTYEKNLHKILSRAATADMGGGSSKGGKDKKGGLLGFLGRRK